MNSAGNLPAHEQQQLMSHFEELQLANSLALYNQVVETCFTECVHGFRSKKLDDKEEGCISKCAEKFLKHSQRVGVRFAEAQAAMAQQQQQ